MLLLGITFSTDPGAPRDFSDLLLLPEPMFQIATDNVLMQTVAGTALGRCFLAGKDGCLYEVVYKAEEGWFSRKCKKVNHSTSALSFLLPSFFTMSEDDKIVQIEVDNSRKILYTRSEKGTIDVYDLGADGFQMSKVISRTLSAIVQQASAIGRTVEPSNFKPIVGISAIEEQESACINLMAVTESGVRLYFSTSHSYRSSARPVTLNLLHVRLPPGFSASSNQRPTRVHQSLHRRGSTFYIAAQSEDRDILWVLNNDPFPFAPNLIEVSAAVSVNSRVWRMTEEIRPQLVNQLSSTAVAQFDRTIALEPPLLVTQDMEESRKFVMLSSNGVHITYKPRPVDHLKQILQDNQGFDNDAVRGFFVLYKEVQACAIALSLACNQTDKLVAEWATLAIFRFGNDSVSGATRNMDVLQQSTGSQFGTSFVAPHISTPVNQPYQGQPAFSSFGVSSPITSQQSVAASPFSPSQPIGQITMPDPVNDFSHRHNGIYLYFSRIIRSIWGYNVVIAQIVTNEQGTHEWLRSSIPVSELNVYIEKLNNLRQWLDKNIQFSMSDGRNVTTLTTLQMERTSLHHLLRLIKNCLEILGLWKILQDHQFHMIADCLTDDYKTALKNFTFRDIVVNGGEVCARLASALVQKFIEDNATTDAISRRLNDACPSIFRQENALHAKAHEMLVRARTITDKAQREALIQEAAQLFKRVGERINLRQACDLLQAVNSYKNIVDLCVQTAAARDIQNLALHFYRNNEPADDFAGRQAYMNRHGCYQVLLEALELLFQQGQNPVQPKSMTAPDPQPPVVGGGVNVLSVDEATKYADFVLKEIIESKDELLHVALYDWLYQRRQSDRLLQIKSPFLEAYLKRKMSTFTESVPLMDLLWMFYERNGHYRAAAEILRKLTERHGTDIDLYHRLQYLSRAIICMKSCQTPLLSDGVSSGELLHELEEKMQVASIQLQLLESLQRRGGDAAEVAEAISCLNSDLHDVTKLYDLAERFRLPEIQLSIVATANHYDPALIENFWQKILEKVLRDAAVQPSESFRAVVINKIESLGKLYISSEKYFPLSKFQRRLSHTSFSRLRVAFIVGYVEEKTQSRNFEPQWLAQAFLTMNISLASLVETYHKLYKARGKCSTWPGKDIQLLRVLSYLLNMFVSNPSTVARNDR